MKTPFEDQYHWHINKETGIILPEPKKIILPDLRKD
jgi:hypothetical protein